MLSVESTLSTLHKGQNDDDIYGKMYNIQAKIGWKSAIEEVSEVCYKLWFFFVFSWIINVFRKYFYKVSQFFKGNMHLDVMNILMNVMILEIPKLHVAGPSLREL